MLSSLLFVATMCNQYVCIVDEVSTPKSITICNGESRAKNAMRFVDADGTPVLLVVLSNCPRA